MKLHEYINLDINEDLGTYKMWDNEYCDFRLWGYKKATKTLKEAYDKNDPQDTTRQAMKYWYAIAQSLTLENALECLDYGTYYCESPIELLYYYCFEYVNKEIESNLHLMAQKEIKANNKKYRVDFVIWGGKENYKYIIECDGYQYHSSSKQMGIDNQRQRDLENEGYTIIRFSGSEIYNDPIKCVYETLKRLNIEKSEDNGNN